MEDRLAAEMQAVALLREIADDPYLSDASRALFSEAADRLYELAKREAHEDVEIAKMKIRAVLSQQQSEEGGA
jgi:hypothetical protein